jgi:hypothetical protein
MSSRHTWSHEPATDHRGWTRRRRHLYFPLPALAVAWALLLIPGCTDEEHLVGPEETVQLEPLLVTAASSSGGVEYEAELLGYLEYSGSLASYIESGNSLNDVGQIVGYNWDPKRALVWDEATGMRGLSHGSFSSCWGFAINNHGVSVGVCRDDSRRAPVRWPANYSGAALEELALVVGEEEYAEGLAYGIHDDGWIVGTLQRDGEGIAVVWDADGAPRQLPHLDESSPNSRAGSVNARGDVVGQSSGRIVVWFDAQGEPIPLPNSDGFWDGGMTFSINEERDIVASGNAKGLLWLYLGENQWRLFRDDTWSNLYDIANRRSDNTLQFVGTSSSLWTVNAVTGEVVGQQQLPLPPELHKARGGILPMAINEQGWIAGVGADHRHPTQIVLWRPVGGEPDPGDPGDPGDPSDPEDPPPGDDPAPVASFTYSCNNTATCNFTDTSTEAVVSWSWTFANADPAESSNQHPGATFESAGNHAVQLVVTDDQDKTSEPATATVTCTVRGQLRCR